jgi:uncharacterized delta-60 repeat protein
MLRTRASRWLHLTSLALCLAGAGACGDSKKATNDAGSGGSGGSGSGGSGSGGSGSGGSPDGGGDAPSNVDGGGDMRVDGGETAPPVPDLDIAVLRFNADGTPDSTFGTNGVAIVDFGPAGGGTRDSLWNIALDAQNRVVLFGSKARAGGSDSDRVVARLTSAGVVDTTFNSMVMPPGTPGFHTLNIANLGDNARAGIVQPDGKIVSAGYTSQPTGVGTQSANKVVLLRLNDNGTPDTTFGVQGVVNSAPFVPAEPTTTPWGMAEAYGAAYQAGKYVTTGYGRAASSGPVDMVSFRYTAAGVLDTTWGTNGIVSLDIVSLDDRGRAVTTIPDPDNRVVIGGSGIPMTAGVIDAMLVRLTPNGAPDTTFAPNGYRLFDFGRTDEAFYGVAVSPDKNWIAAAGYRAGGMEDDDAVLALVPLAAGAAEFAMAVPLSETANDRFWNVTFDANNKAVATGFSVAAGTDTQMVVARFNTDGTRDTTFGAGGLVVKNVVTAGNVEAARGIAVQSDGKIVIAGAVEKP